MSSLEPALFQDAVGVSVGPVGVPGGLAACGGGGRRHCRQPGSGLALSRDNFILFYEPVKCAKKT
jgi:hypothetical protein